MGEGALTVRFDAGEPSVVYVVCIWGPKPQFGGQRPKVWCSDKLTTPEARPRIAGPFFSD